MQSKNKKAAHAISSRWGGHIKISTKGRYALQIMMDLAVHNTGEYIALPDIATRQELTPKYLEHIAATLSREGYVESIRGKSGGYRLSRRPSEYRVGDILRTMEGDLTPVTDRDFPFDHGDPAIAAIAPFWRAFGKVVNEFVDRYTLEDLCDNYASLIGGDYSI